MNRKHMPLLIGGLVVLLVAGALVYLLFTARSRYQEKISALSATQNRLTRLTSRPVFPAQENVQTLEKQTGIYEEYLNGLYGAMRAGQFPTEEVGRARFPLVLEEVLGDLVRLAEAQRVVLPADFSFGFQRYTAGNLPAEEEVERLVIQVRSAAALCNILFEAGIAELLSVDRTIFEKDAQVLPVEEEYSRRSSRRSAETPEQPVISTELYRDPDGLFTKEHYVLSFRTAGKAFWKVLDRFAQGTPFVVLTKTEIVNSARPAVVAPKTSETPKEPLRPAAPVGWQTGGLAPGQSPATPEPEILPRDLRVVAGQELPLVRLELDLYRFAEPAAAAEQGEENP